LQWFTRKPLGYSVEPQNQDRRLDVEAKQVAVTGHPSDEEYLKTSKFALEGLVSLVIK
jgi:preprotein translocase subunit Sss1